MKHLTAPQFWEFYQNLASQIQDLADKNFALLKQDATHPSLHLKKEITSGLSGSVLGIVRWLFSLKKGYFGSGLVRMPTMIEWLIIDLYCGSVRV